MTADWLTSSMEVTLLLYISIFNMKITDDVFSKAIEIAHLFGVKRLLVFGSAIKPNREACDIDFACEGVEGWKLYQFGAALEDALHMHIDLIPLDEPSEFTRLIEMQGKRIL